MIMVNLIPRRPDSNKTISIRHRAAIAWLTPGAYRVLEVEATRRSTHPDRLAAEVLETILLHDGALDAIIGC